MKMWMQFNATIRTIAGMQHTDRCLYIIDSRVSDELTNLPTCLSGFRFKSSIILTHIDSQHSRAYERFNRSNKIKIHAGV